METAGFNHQTVIIVGVPAMYQETHFVISKSHSQYCITECGSSGVKQAFMTEGNISGDQDVLIKLSRIVPANQGVRSFVEKNAGHLICIYDTAMNSRP